MKYILTYLLIAFAASDFLGAQECSLPHLHLVSPKHVKHAFEKRAGVRVNADKARDASLVPRIHDSIWPEFCATHLQSDPDGCSAWDEDKKGNALLDYLLDGSSTCRIDRDLLRQLQPFIYLMPKCSSYGRGRCDYAQCSQCSKTVLRALSYEEEDENEDDEGNLKQSYRYYLVYKCGCTKGWWLDIDNLWNEEITIYQGWRFCKAPTIYHGYVEWHHQSYFCDLLSYLAYIEQNPECNCYWPQMNAKAKKVSNVVYEKLSDVCEGTSLDELRKSFTPYLYNRSQHGFLSGLLTHAFFYSNYRTILTDLDRHCCAAIDYEEIHDDCIDLERILQYYFLPAYNECLKKHPHPKIYYERGMLLFHNGENLDALEDIGHFLAYAEGNNYQELLTSDLYLQEGRLLSESLSYDEAIIALTKALEKDPKNSEAYFERAFAYFETGNFEKSLSDYLASGIHLKKIESQKVGQRNYTALSQGMALGMLQGGQEAALEFVPSLLSSLRGIGRGLWAFVSSPIAFSQDFIDAAFGCMEYVKERATPSVLSQLVPELQECMERWRQLDDCTKGKYMGHVIGKYGVDLFIGGGSVQAMKYYRELRKANTLMTLETAALSPKLAKEVFEQAAKEEALRRSAFKSANLKIRWDKQGLHVPGDKRYKLEDRRSILTHTDPQALVNKYAGTGRKVGTGIPGQPGYKEIVDFEEHIGYYVDLKTGESSITTMGSIDYAKNGTHIVPRRPR